MRGSFQPEKIVDDIENNNFSIHVYSKFLEHLVFPIFPLSHFFFLSFSLDSPHNVLSQSIIEIRTTEKDRNADSVDKKEMKYERFMELMILVLSFFRIQILEIIIIFS